MKSKTILGIIVAAVILIGAAYAYSLPAGTSAYISNPAPTGTGTTTVPVTTPPAGTPPATTPSGYTIAQVASHNSGASCWTAISGNVYDLTAWISQHPGGSQAILSLCGVDGTAAFDAQHGGQRSPERELASLKIGALLK